jgi:hypothetical protein
MTPQKRGQGGRVGSPGALLIGPLPVVPPPGRHPLARFGFGLQDSGLSV